MFVGKQRRFNRRFLPTGGHYRIAPVAGTPRDKPAGPRPTAAGWEKGPVENPLGNIRERLFAPRLRMASGTCPRAARNADPGDEPNAWLLDQGTAGTCPRAGQRPDSGAGTPINESLVRDLATGAFLVQQHAAVLVGGTSTGKSYLAIAIAHACIRGGARGRFSSVVDLVAGWKT